MEAFWKKIADVLFLSKLEKRWQKIAKALAVIVVFWTTYMLILPAITMENDTYCGLHEHKHEDSCYIIESILICDIITENEETTSNTEESSSEENSAEESTSEVTTTEETISEEITTEETTIEETTAEITTTEETSSGEADTEISEIVEEIHSHTSECYKYNKTLICENEEHTHEESCFFEELAMYAVNPMALSENGIATIADSTYATKVNFDNLDGTGSTYYIVYTLYNGTYYAVPGTLNGRPLAITVNDNGTIPVASLGNNYYWKFTQQSGSTYKIQNLGSGRYMHSFYNSSSDYGITTSGDWTSELISSGNGTSKTFSVKSNSNYSRLTGSGSGVAFSTTTTASSAAQFYIAEVYIPQDAYHVWFDGTCGGLMSLYESPNTYMAVSGNNNTIILPEEWESPSKYDYVLNGWYDIKNSVYYEPGARVTITKNTVFYADWIARDYNVGIVNDENVNLLAPSLDTNSFIRTDMFDYSAIFNMQAVTHSGTVSASSHNETWSIVQNGKVPYNDMDSLGFTFRDWDSGNVNISYAANRARLNDNKGTEITSGIVDYVANMSGKNIIDLLFNPETDVIGKTHVGQANYLYQFMEAGSNNYDGEHNGYYYYDSRYNAASYNQKNERFYIYEYLERTSDSLKDGFDSNGNPTAGGSYSDFLPFNSPYTNNSNNKVIVEYDDSDGNGPNYQYDAKATNQSSNIANAGTNYWFGMKSEIQFYLPDDTGTVDQYMNYGNISSHGQHMTFEFSGDDDLWVFVDGELVMDIGGLHGIMSGKIDFSTGIITTTAANNVEETDYKASVTNYIDLAAGDHTLTVYYMERGGSQSNCAIYFNLTPRYGFELVKQDSVDGHGLNGAVFGVYTDIDCTLPAMLWTSEASYMNDEKSTNIFTAKDGMVKFWGVSAGKVYYLKELIAPTGYPLTDDVIRISMNSLGNSICSVDALRGEDGTHTDGFDIIHNNADEAHQQIALTLTNQQYTSNKRNVAVSKHWNAENESLIPENVTVYLLANGQNTGRSAVLSEENNWTYLWIDLPIYDSIGAKIDYSVYEEQAEDFYTDVVVDGEEVISAWVQTDAFYDGGTFLIVNRETGKALTVNRYGNFEWIEFDAAKNSEAAHWIVNADGMGFHVIDEAGYHIVLDGTNRFIPDQAGNRILYHDNFGLAARYSNTYYYMNDNFSASSTERLELELYINMDILIHEDDSSDIENGTNEPEEDTENDGEIFVTMFNVTNTHIDEDEKTSFHVKKSWDDGITNHIHDSITVRLYANGVDTGRALTLNNANGWNGSFKGLRYKDDNGNVIEYTVVEDDIYGYYPEYSEITETPGQTKTETIITEDWSTVTSLAPENTYRFVNSSGYALTAYADNTSVSTEVSDPDNLYQRWLFQGGKLQNVGKSTGSSDYYLYQTINGTDRTLSVSTSTTNNNTNFSYTRDKLRIGTNNNYSYIVLGTDSVSLQTDRNNATTPTMHRLGTKSETITTYLTYTYSITVTNYKAYYILPETGGIGTHYLYIIGGPLVTLSAGFLLCLYKKNKGRRRIDSG
ncbi:MAG: Cna B-type domain-containing protein [Clostridia bacterium]|nr:Cna B-type domain-containing protein [Clostridia bacterium]